MRAGKLVLKQSSLRCGTARELPRPHPGATSQQSFRMRGCDEGLYVEPVRAECASDSSTRVKPPKHEIPTCNPTDRTHPRPERPRAGVPRAVPQRSEDCLSTGPPPAAPTSQVELLPQPRGLPTRRSNYALRMRSASQLVHASKPSPVVAERGKIGACGFSWFTLSSKAS